MLKLALIFLVVAIIAAVFGFGGIAAAATDIAVLLFWLFIILFVSCAVAHAVTGRKPPV